MSWASAHSEPQQLPDLMRCEQSRSRKRRSTEGEGSGKKGSAAQCSAAAGGTGCAREDGGVVAVLHAGDGVGSGDEVLQVALVHQADVPVCCPQPQPNINAEATGFAQFCATRQKRCSPVHSSDRFRSRTHRTAHLTAASQPGQQQGDSLMLLAPV